MRKVVMPDRATGFCPTVERAVGLLLKAAQAARQLGGSVVYRDAPSQCQPLIQRFLAQGLPLVEYCEGMELTRCVWYISPYGGGEPPEGFDRRRVYDTTCVVVEAEWKTAEQAVQRGRRVVFCGEQSHPEATSLMRRFPNGVVVVETPGDLECLDVGAGPFTVLSQSTFSTRAAHAIIEELYEIDGAEVEDLREVCPQVAHRKREAATLGKFKPAVVIIGRHESHHAREMARLAREEGCERVEIISSAEEAAALGLSDGIEVGLLSTTSTPEELVEAVAAALRG